MMRGHVGRTSHSPDGWLQSGDGLLRDERQEVRDVQASLIGTQFLEGAAASDCAAARISSLR